MGTDIFMFLEYQFEERDSPYWSLYASFRLPRNYDLFSLLGDEHINVTPKPAFHFRGLPKEVSNGFCQNAAWVVVDYDPKSPGESVINCYIAKREIEVGELMQLKVSGSDKVWVTYNFRRASWHYASEYKIVLEEYKKLHAEGNKFFEAILPMMQILNDGDYTRSRLVYYFL
jgi:hypothetical protein